MYFHLLFVASGARSLLLPAPPLPHRHCILIKSSNQPRGQASPLLSPLISPATRGAGLLVNDRLPAVHDGACMHDPWSAGGVGVGLVSVAGVDLVVAVPHSPHSFPSTHVGELRPYQVDHRLFIDFLLIATPSQLRYFRFRMRELQRSVVDPAFGCALMLLSKSL